MARILLRLFTVVGILAVAFLAWRVFLHVGPAKLGDGKSALFRLHAKYLIQQRAAFPRPAAGVLIPVPSEMSSADVQLKLMKWREGHRWLPTALAMGEAGKGGLRVRGGQLDLLEVVRVGPAEVKEGKTSCTVVCKVRWVFPAELQELLRVREIVGLRLPRGLAPDQTAEISCRLVQDGWRWQLESASSPWGGKLELPVRKLAWHDWLL